MSDPGSAWGRRLAAPIAIAGLLALAGALRVSTRETTG